MEDDPVPDVIRFLRASGVDMTAEQVEQVIRFQRRADEGSDTMERVARAYPIKRNNVALKARWEAKDPNVKAAADGEGTITYERQFTEAQIKNLENAYIASRPPLDDNYPLGWSHEAKVFVRIVESWATSVDLFQAIAPPDQKARTRALDSVSNALTKLDQALAALDSSALGYLYAKVADALAVVGFQLSESDNRSVSMIDNPPLAVAEAGEGRQRLRKIIAEIVKATNSASEDLPTFDRVENDSRLRAAREMERLMREHQLPFEANETGFAAQCIRAMFELADLDVEKVGYWIKKAIDHPDSDARWLQGLRERAE